MALLFLPAYIVLIDAHLVNMRSLHGRWPLVGLDEALERVNVGVARENDEEDAEPDELGGVQGESPVSIAAAEPEGLPLVRPNEVHVDDG